MRVAILGNNDGPLRLADALENTDHQVVGIGLQKQPDIAFAKAYQQFSAPLEQTPREKHAIRFLQNKNFDVLINCFANFRFKRLLDLYDVINIHPSPLPKYRGRHPLHWALINGEQTFGASIHRMTSKIDAGEILYQNSVDVQPEMNVQDLREAVFQPLIEQFPQFIDDLENGSIQTIPNDGSQATYVARRFPEDSELTEWRDAGRIYRKIKALSSEKDKAYVSFRGEQVYVVDVKWAERRFIGISSPFVFSKQNEWVGMACLDGKTLLLKLGNSRNIRLNDRPDGH